MKKVSYRTKANAGLKFPIYTVIYIKARIALNINEMEYCLCDTIHKLQVNPKAPIPGWCNATREYFATFFGYSKRQILRSIEKLVKMGIVEKHSSKRIYEEVGVWGKGNINDLLRVTEVWYNATVVDGGDNYRMNLGDILSPKSDILVTNRFNLGDKSGNYSIKDNNKDNTWSNFKNSLKEVTTKGNLLSEEMKVTLFEGFWPTYKNHENKKGSLRAWCEKIQTLDDYNHVMKVLGAYMNNDDSYIDGKFTRILSEFFKHFDEQWVPKAKKWLSRY